MMIPGSALIAGSVACFMVAALIAAARWDSRPDKQGGTYPITDDPYPVIRYDPQQFLPDPAHAGFWGELQDPPFMAHARLDDEGTYLADLFKIQGRWMENMEDTEAPFTTSDHPVRTHQYPEPTHRTTNARVPIPVMTDGEVAAAWTEILNGTLAVDSWLNDVVVTI